MTPAEVTEQRVGRDRGSALVLTLVLIVIGTLIVAPLLSYSMTMMRANTALSAKGQRLDAIRGGMRAALVDPQALYNHCQAGAAEIPVAGDLNTADPFTPLYPAGVRVNDVDVITTCKWIGGASAVLDDHLRYGLVATRRGATVNASLHGEKYQAATDPAAWHALTVATDNDQGVGEIWLPKLPAFPTVVRDEPPAPPTGYTVNGTCKVFFPGHYKHDIVLNGPTYFASGIYYFEGTVSVVAGADVTVGDGRISGCTTSQEAVFSASPDVAEHNVTGFGATWLFGGAGRLAVDSTGGALRLEFNRRYVDNDDVVSDPSLYLSIASVNGTVSAGAISDLAVVDTGTTVLRVPRSYVVGDPSPLAHNMTPSTLVRVPQPPTWTSSPAATAHAWKASSSATTGTVYLTWKEPPVAEWGGRPITEFRIYRPGTTTPVAGGTVSVTAGTRFLDLNGVAAQRAGWRYQATLTNVPTSTTRLEMTVVNSSGLESARITVPTTNMSFPVALSPSTPAQLAQPVTANRFSNGFRISVPTGTSAGTSPIRLYEVQAFADNNTTTAVGSCPIDPRSTSGPWSCVINGLTGSNYRFSVRATNQSGVGAWSPLSSNSPVVNRTTGTAPANPAAPTPPGMPTVTETPPVPIVQINLPSTSPGTTVRIPGYVAVPQGTFNVHNPNSVDVRIIGGVLAAEMNVDDGRVNSQGCIDAGGVNCIDLGFEAEATQSKLRLVSRSTTGNEVSVAVIQINENGAYAVNSWEVQ